MSDVGVGSERQVVGFTWEQLNQVSLCQPEQNYPAFPQIKVVVQMCKNLDFV